MKPAAALLRLAIVVSDDTRTQNQLQTSVTEVVDYPSIWTRDDHSRVRNAQKSADTNKILASV
jgi:hypothetical protein